MRITLFVLKNAAVLSLALLAMVMPSFALSPVNDLCANRTPLTPPNQITTGSLEEAHADPPHGVNTYINRPEVYYSIVIPAGARVKATITVTGIAGTHIYNPMADLFLTNLADPCGGPLVPKGGNGIGAPIPGFPQDPDDPNNNGYLDQGESFAFTTECLAPGTYLLALHMFGTPEANKGGFTIELLTATWQQPSPGNGKSSDSGGTQKDVFAPGDGVFFAGNLTPSVVNDIYIIPAQTLGDGQAIPNRVPNSALWINTDASGHVIDSSLDVYQNPAGEIAYSGIAPAKVWIAPPSGAYTIVVDRNGDGVFNASFDVVDSNGFVVVSPPIGVPALGPLGLITMIFGLGLSAALILAFRRRVSR
jgi:hypothetical protein